MTKEEFQKYFKEKFTEAKDLIPKEYEISYGLIINRKIRIREDNEFTGISFPTEKNGFYFCIMNNDKVQIMQFTKATKKSAPITHAIEFNDENISIVKTKIDQIIEMLKNNPNIEQI